MGFPNLPKMYTTYLLTPISLRLSPYPTLCLPRSLPPPPSPLAGFQTHWMISTVKYVRVHSTNIRCFSVTYVTQDGTWTAFSHLLSLFHMESRNAPYASRATSYPRQQHSTFAFLPPFSISTLIKIFQTNDSLSLIRVFALPITI